MVTIAGVNLSHILEFGLPIFFFAIITIHEFHDKSMAHGLDVSLILLATTTNSRSIDSTTQKFGNLGLRLYALPLHGILHRFDTSSFHIIFCLGTVRATFRNIDVLCKWIVRRASTVGHI